MGWYCGAMVFALIGRQSLSPGLALQILFNKNNNIIIIVLHNYFHYVKLLVTTVF